MDEVFWVLLCFAVPAAILFVPIVTLMAVNKLRREHEKTVAQLTAQLRRSQEGFEKHRPKTFVDVVRSFGEFQDWKARRDRYIFNPDGTVTNPNGIDDPEFFEALEGFRSKDRATKWRNPLEDE